MSNDIILNTPWKNLNLITFDMNHNLYPIVDDDHMVLVNES